MAGLVHKIKHSSADGIPIGAGVTHKKFKVIMFDHVIFQRLLGLELSQHLLIEDFETINKGNLAEQFAGAEILKYQNPRNKPHLYYCKMQSMWMFLKERSRENGIRISLENFSSYSCIHVYPLYGMMNIFDYD